MTKRLLQLRSSLHAKTNVIVSLLLLSVLTLGLGTAFAGEQITINNPYDGVSWDKEHQHKANLHTHTSNTDGALRPHEVVDAYKALGYSALAITDHNKFTYPWTEFSQLQPSGKGPGRDNPELRTGFEDRDPEQVGMTSILGNEFSSHHHMVNLWTDSQWDRHDMMTQIHNSEKDGGQLIFAHPGRYRWFIRQNKDKPGAWSPERYIELFQAHNNFIGLEVYNAGDKYPQDRELWDIILKELMPARPVWGFSNDDMHREEQIGRNQTILLVEKPTEEQIKEALAKGQFFFVYCPNGHDGAKPPTIEKISVDDESLSISVTVDEAKTFEWISDGKVVGTEAILELTKVKELGNYVRLMIYGTKDDTVIGTQPFGIVREK